MFGLAEMFGEVYVGTLITFPFTLLNYIRTILLKTIITSNLIHIYYEVLPYHNLGMQTLLEWWAE